LRDLRIVCRDFPGHQVRLATETRTEITGGLLSSSTGSLEKRSSSCNAVDHSVKAWDWRNCHSIRTRNTRNGRESGSYGLLPPYVVTVHVDIPVTKSFEPNHRVPDLVSKARIGPIRSRIRKAGEWIKGPSTRCASVEFT